MITRLKPQTLLILKHLLFHGSLTGVEAAAVYKARSLPKRISELNAAGYNVKRKLFTDATGQRYARYSI